MIYLSSFRLSNEQVKNPNIYPYHVFRGKDMEPFVFSPITVLYGNNGSGKSTILNIMANKLMVKGREYATSNSFGIVDYCGFRQNIVLATERMSLAIPSERFLKTADSSKAKTSYMRSRKFSRSRFWRMEWNMII